MKKMAALFTESMREFRNIRTIPACGLFAALALILNSFTVQIGNYLKIGVSGLPNEMVDVLFGPAVGSLFAAAMDILKLLLYPTGAWIPGLTLNCLLAGLIFPVPQTDKLLADSGGGADSGAFGERPARNLLAVSGVR